MLILCYAWNGYLLLCLVFLDYSRKAKKNRSIVQADVFATALRRTNLKRLFVGSADLSPRDLHLDKLDSIPALRYILFEFDEDDRPPVKQLSDLNPAEFKHFTRNCTIDIAAYDPEQLSNQEIRVLEKLGFRKFSPPGDRNSYSEFYQRESSHLCDCFGMFSWEQAVRMMQTGRQDPSRLYSKYLSAVRY